MTSNNNKRTNTSNTGLVIVSWNARGIVGQESTKLAELMKFLAQTNHDVDIICIQETWETTKSKPPKIKGYQLPIFNYSTSREAGGGTCIYVKIGISFSLNPVNNPTPIDVTSITVHDRDKKLTIFNTYTRQCDNTMINYRQIFNVKDNDIIIVGDFNIKHPCWNPEFDFRCDDEAGNMLDFCSDRQLCILNDGQITRLAPELDRRDSAIDLVIVSSHMYSSCEFYVLDNTCGSDHFPILTNTKFTINKTQYNNDRKWNFKKATNENWAAFKEECRKKITCTTESDVNASFVSIVEQLSEILNSTMPKYRFKDTKENKTVPWWNDECTTAAKKRENLRRNYKKDKKSLAKLKLWHDARRDAKKLFQKAKKASWRAFCQKNKHKYN